jgi:putative serine protease PepD
MKRTLVSLILAAALALTACTAGSTQTDTAEPAAVFPSSQPSFATGQDAVVEVVEQVLPAVVNVVAESGQGQGEGTGFIVRSDGIVVTNFHVVEGATTVTVLTSDDDPVEYDARVIGGDIQDDLAVLEIEAKGLPTVPLGRSADLQLGQPVVAIGYALGLAGGPSVTTGIVSSLTRRITVEDANCAECEGGERVYTDVIQTDAAINPGNSGGPLVDLAGRVVGINTAGAGSAENIGFAIQIDAAKPVIEQAEDNPSPPIAFMGVEFDFASLDGDGVLIAGVVEGGPADAAGVLAGDVVVLFDGQLVSSAEQLRELIRSHAPGDQVEVGLVRADGSEEVVTLVLDLNPTATA